MIRRILGICIIFGFLVGCSIQIGGDVSSKDDKKIDKNTVQAFGEGVYYFPFRELKFPKALAEFLKDHPSLEVTAVCGDSKGLYGKYDGYVVVFKEKK